MVLRIIQKISIAQICNLFLMAVSYYGKVTLFGDGRVVKAKKTRPVASEGRRGQTGEERPVFEESFNILFPPEYLDRVSCIISLCGKTRAGDSRVTAKL